MITDDPAQAPRSTFEMRGRPRAVTLGDAGIHHPRAPRGSGFVYTPYEDVTHLATTHRALWLGARRSVYVLARSAFVDPYAPEHLVRMLLARIAQRPGGSAQLARMAEIEETARSRGPLRATWSLASLCLLVFLLQLTAGQSLHEVGYFNAALVADGDLWRVVTANLLHAFPRVPIHLVCNLIGLILLGALAERSLGTARTVCVMGASGLGAMAACAIRDQVEVVGVSGVVFGLLGALLWLEFRCANRLPAWWRIPRRALVILLAVNLGLPLLVPIISGAAHVGGLLCGFLVTAAVAGTPPGRRPSPAWVRGASAAVGLLGLLSVAAAGWELSRPGDFLARHTARFASLPGVTPEELNNRAWFVAIDPGSSRENLEAALLLAERAVNETARQDAPILDTLAELQFQLGLQDEAIETIDEAIAREPDESYYWEQRRRFLGDRDPGDRPAAPWPPPTPDQEPAPDDRGIRV